MRCALYSAVIAALLATSARAENKCNLGRVADVPITMTGLRPLMSAQVNGTDAKFLLDSGAFFSTMSTAAAADLNLKLGVAGGSIVGIGGTTRTWLTKVKDFDALGMTFHDVEFLVTGSEITPAIGLIGQNLLSRFDVEYDLGNGVVRLFKPENCARTALAYWAAGKGFSLMDINPVSQYNPHTIGVAYVNGHKLQAMFDTGASTSVLAFDAAKNIGIDVEAPGVVSAGYSMGIGRGVAKSYIVPVASFKIGDDEEIKNTRLRVARFRLRDADMLIGADFFLSHHVFVSNSQHKLYLTYSGGPVFNLANAGPVTAAAAPSTPAETPAEAPEGLPSGKQAPAPAPADSPDGAPLDAGELARRGAALAARRDFVPALADMSKALDLQPNDPNILYERARIYRDSGATAPALSDLDRLISLKPDSVDALVMRAQLRLSQKKFAETILDLDRAAQLAPPQSDLRFKLAQLYAGAADPSGAIKQWDLWIDSHPVDARFIAALGERCYMRALQNQDLPLALSDCNRAMRLANMRLADNAVLSANHGMVRLRQGAFDKAISDFNDALKLQPKNVRALYGRGIARMRLNKRKEGQGDVDAAVAISPAIRENLARFGLEP
jgi:tetratricopeptide (TPR) repeat protein/predicted aspartyl protease